jgi:hypothetical protein
MKGSNYTTIILFVLIAINTLFLLFLSCLHFYWGFGGSLWYTDVLPSNSTGSKRLNPGITTTFVVAFGLLLLALITIGNLGIWDKSISRKYFRYGALLISIVFFTRAIGDFKFVGFFKAVKGTRFAVNDTQFFTPFCVFVAATCLLIFVFNKSDR